MKPSPISRLDFWTVSHKLRHRLERYQVSEVPRPFRHLTWNDLRFWALMLEEDDERIGRLVGADEEIPTPEEWFGKVEA